MPKSVKITLLKIEIKNQVIKTPKVSVMLEFGGSVEKLPNARFAHKNQVSFFRQPLTAITQKEGCGINISILGVTGSHEKEIGLVKMANQQLIENDGETQLVRRGNDDFILEFEVLYSSVHQQDRIMTEESQTPSADSFFEVEINKQSLGRDSVSIAEGKGKRDSSNKQTPERTRPSFQKADRNSLNFPPVLEIDRPLKISQIRKPNELRLSLNSNKSPKQQLVKLQPTRSSQPIQLREEPKQMYTSTKTIKVIKQKQSRILKATLQEHHEEQHHEHHHENSQFKRKDYLHLLIVSLIFWYLGRFLKQI